MTCVYVCARGRHSGASPRSAMLHTPVDTWGAALNMLLFGVLPQSQAEAHYKGNRHARRVKGIETSKSRPQEGDKPHAAPPTSSPSPSGAAGTPPDSEPSKSGEKRRALKKKKNNNRVGERKGAYKSFMAGIIRAISARCSEA